MSKLLMCEEVKYSALGEAVLLPVITHVTSGPQPIRCKVLFTSVF